MTARIISVANIKGGVSKTSTSLFLATALAKNKGKKVLYLDCDSQASACEYRRFEKQYEEDPEPYRIRPTDPDSVYDVLEDNKDNYDIIFIDLPRLTKKQDDQSIAMMLALCDSVLIPITSGELDNMSTQGFVKIIKRIAERKKGKRQYHYAGFASMTGRIPTEDKATKEFMKTLNIPIFNNEMKNLKRFAKPYTYDSLLDIGAEERKGFEPFYNEVIEFFNL